MLRLELNRIIHEVVSDLLRYSYILRLIYFENIVVLHLNVPTNRAYFFCKYWSLETIIHSLFHPRTTCSIFSKSHHFLLIFQSQRTGSWSLCSFKISILLTERSFM
jgi:hypothetical protein